MMMNINQKKYILLQLKIVNYYQIAINVQDYMQPHYPASDKKFEKYWQEALQQGYHQQDSSYQLSYKTLDSAIKNLIKHFGNYLGAPIIYSM